MKGGWCFALVNFCLVNFEGFLVLIFGSSWVFNFLLIILGVFNFFVWSFTKGRHICYSSCELWRVFVLVFWSFRVFIFFFLSFLGDFKFFVWSFTRGENKYFPFFLWTLKVFYFDILKFWNLKKKESCHFGGLQILLVKFHKGGRHVFAFLLVNFEGFLFWYFEILEFKISYCHFGGFAWREIILGVFFLIWGFSTLFWWNSRILDFALVDFRGSNLFF